MGSVHRPPGDSAGFGIAGVRWEGVSVVSERGSTLGAAVMGAWGWGPGQGQAGCEQ